MSRTRKNSEIPRRTDGIVARVIAGETVLVPVQSEVALCDEVYVLNPAGSWLWEALDGSRSADDLIEAMVDEFEVPSHQQARIDVERFLAAMDDRGLIRWAAR